MAEPPSDSEPSCLQGWGWVSLTVFSSRGSPRGGRHKAKSSLYLPLYLLLLRFLGSLLYYEERYFTSTYCFIV